MSALEALFETIADFNPFRIFKRVLVTPSLSRFRDAITPVMPVLSKVCFKRHFRLNVIQWNINPSLKLFTKVQRL